MNDIIEYLKKYFDNIDPVTRDEKLSDPFEMQDILEQGGFCMDDLENNFNEIYKELDKYFCDKDINDLKLLKRYND
jgi:hypothetical protein